MKTFLLLLGGAGLGVLGYLIFSPNQNQPSAADKTAAWGDGERLAGAGNTVKGSLKQGVGKLTGDDSTQVSGLVDKVKGAAEDLVGSAAQKVSEA